VIRVATVVADEYRFMKSKPFTHNRLFKTDPSSTMFVADDGRIICPSTENYKFDHTYRTRFFAYTAHNGVIYRDNTYNLMLAFKHRMLACRIPPSTTELAAYDWDCLLADNQQHALIKYTPVLLQLLSSSYEYTTNDYRTALEEWSDHYADTHPKKRLRVEWSTEAIDTGDIADHVWRTRTTRPIVRIKFKKNEWAKPGKVGRSIGDLGVGMSLQGFITMMYYKNAMSSNDLVLTNGVAHFCSVPSAESLVNVFTNLIEPSTTFYLAYFSDDSCLSIRSPDGNTHIFNVDISSCDASHRSIFSLLLDLAPPALKHDVSVLIDQLSLPIRIESSELDAHGKNFFLTGQFTCPRLFSGSVVTTTLNNLAELLFACALDEVDWANDNATIQNQVVAAFQSVGYMCTMQPCHIPGHLQFLKHSPTFDTSGELHAVLNIGVLLRLSGTCTYDLPGRGDIRERARAFQASLLHGIYLNTHFTLIDRMRRSCSSRLPVDLTLAASHIDGKDVVRETTPTYFDDHELYSRYSLFPHEITELNDFLGHAGYGDSVSCTAIDKILALDYSLGAPPEYTELDDTYYAALTDSYVATLPTSYSSAP